MSYAVYKGYVMIASASHDEATGQWRPVASVTWRRASDGRRGIQLFTELSETFPTFAEATSFAMAVARNWADNRRGTLD